MDDAYFFNSLQAFSSLAHNLNLKQYARKISEDLFHCLSISPQLNEREMEKKKKNNKKNNRRKADDEKKITKFEKGMNEKLPDLTDDIMVEILSMLSIRPLLQCMAVSTTLRNIIRDQYFTKLHRSRAIQHQNQKLSYIVCNRGDWHERSNLYLVEGGMKTEAATVINLRFNTIRKCGGHLLPHNDPDKIDCAPFKFEVVGSCNGFLCLRQVSKFPSVNSWVCNPLTREYVKLPISVNFQSYILYGFGFDSINQDYKVMRMFPKRDCSVSTKGYKALIHTIGKDKSWRWITPVPSTLTFNSFFSGTRYSDVLVSGALHWATDDGQILALNMSTEEFYMVPTPQLCPNEEKSSNLKVCCLMGHLTLVYFSAIDGCFTIWEMEDYGIADSWIKRVVDTSNLSQPIHSDGFLTNLALKSRFCMGRYGNFKIPWRVYSVVSHVPSFVSLSEAIGTEVKRFN